MFAFIPKQTPVCRYYNPTMHDGTIDEARVRDNLDFMKALPLLAFVFLSAISLHAATIKAEPFPPAAFASLFLENDDRSGTTIVQVSGDAVIYKRTELGGKVLEMKTVHPSGEDWFKFIQALNAAKVYKWSRNYQYPGQGPSWVIDIGMENRKFYSEGTNEYPKNGDETQPAGDPKAGPSIPFSLYWAAVLELCGKGKVDAMKQ